MKDVTYWIIKEDKNLDIQVGNAIYTTSKKKVPVQVGDYIFIIEDVNGKWGIQTLWTVEEVKEIGEKKEIPERIIVIMYKYEVFDIRHLDHYIFSLSCIKNYKNPDRDFRYFKKLMPVEVPMILKGDVNEIRSLIGFTFYNMHRDHQIGFLNFLGLQDLSQKYIVYNEKKLLEKMNDYVTVHIINPSEQFLKSIEFFKKMFGSEFYSKLSFSEGQNMKNISYAINQEKVLLEYLGELKKYFGPSFKIKENARFDKYYLEFKMSPIVFKID